MAARRGNGFVYKPSAGPGAGDGWGGSAKGAGTGGPKPAPFSSENQPSDRSTVKSTRELRAKRTEELEDILLGLARTADRQETQVMAATKLHAIYNGQPVAAVQHSGPNGDPMQIEAVRRVIIDPAASVPTSLAIESSEDYGCTHH